MTTLPNQSPRWNRYTKAFVATTVAAAGFDGLAFPRIFATAIGLALILAYVLDPFVEAARRLRIGRTVALALVYVIFIIILLSF